ncbi:MAG: hypothetical protein M1133_11610 [Armatimonadetes bacterium]|nr:hypothetical protein [Armatimonadota bacterium]
MNWRLFLISALAAVTIPSLVVVLSGAHSARDAISALPLFAPPIIVGIGIGEVFFWLLKRATNRWKAAVLRPLSAVVAVLPAAFAGFWVGLGYCWAASGFRGPSSDGAGVGWFFVGCVCAAAAGVAGFVFGMGIAQTMTGNDVQS